MRRRPKDLAHDPDQRPSHLTHYRPEDWIDAPAPPGPDFVSGCPVCAYWFAQGQWAEAHPNAPLDFDFDAPDDPWHAELI